MLRQFAVCRWWRHSEILFLCAHPLEQATLGSLSGNNDLIASTVCKRTFLRIESQACLLSLLIGSMASEAGIRQDGPDVAIEINGLGLGRLGSDQVAYENDEQEQRRQWPDKSRFQEHPPSA